MIKVEMHFLADIYVKCDNCEGKRYNEQTLEVKFKGIAGIGVNAVVKSRQIKDGEKVFYSIQQTMTLLSSKLKMLELTKEGFYDE